MARIADSRTTGPLSAPLCAIAVGALLLLCGWNLSIRWAMLFQHRTELGGVEHNVIHGIQKLVLGETLYEDPEAPPFDVIQYTPAYHVLCAGIAKSLGIEGHDARSIYILSRAVSLFFNVLTCWFVYRGCRVAGAAQWTSLFAAGLTLGAYWEQFFTRMDSLAAAATFAAFYHLLRWQVDQRSGQLVLCGALATLAFLAKQSGLVALALPVLYLLLDRQWRALRVLLPTIAIGLCVGFAAMFIWLGTPWAIYQNAVVGLTNGFSRELFQALFAPSMYKYFLGWHILGAIIIWRGVRSPVLALRFLALAIPFSLAFALVTGLKYGSRLNYLHESLTLTFMGAAVLLPQVRTSAWSKAVTWATIGYGLLFVAFRTNSIRALYNGGEPDALQARILQDDAAVRDVLVNDLHLKADEKVFITYREYLEHFLVGQSMLTQKDIVQYSKTRLFNYTRFHQAMRDGTVRFVITDAPPGPITYLDSTYTGWEPVREVKGRTIYARRARP
jgi:hypothetical protein